MSAGQITLSVMMGKKKKSLKISQSEFIKRFGHMKDCVDIQCAHGNYDYSPYMHGMANGMLLAMALMEDKDPDYIDSIKHYLCDDKGKRNGKNRRLRRRK